MLFNIFIFFCGAFCGLLTAAVLTVASIADDDMERRNDESTRGR